MCVGLIVFCVGLDASMGGGDVPDAETLQVRERGFGPLVNLKGSFYQDRLWTNIRKVLKKTVVFLQTRSRLYCALTRAIMMAVRAV